MPANNGISTLRGKQRCCAKEAGNSSKFKDNWANRLDMTTTKKSLGPLLAFILNLVRHHATFYFQVFLILLSKHLEGCCVEVEVHESHLGE
jgi:hypothetical protein